MFIETFVYDNPHQSGTQTSNQLINVNHIVKIAPVIDAYGKREESFIYLHGIPSITYIRSSESYELIRSKINRIKLL